MITRRNPDIPSDRDLVALADGSLPASRRARVERAVASSPELTARVAEQRRALTAIRETAEPAPGALRARLELARDPRPLTRLWRLSAARVAVGGATAAALATLALLTLGGGAAVQPTVAAAATLGTRVPAAPAPGTSNDHGLLPGISAAGVPFPDWAGRFGYTATGVRYDRIGGRLATTVFYRRANQDVAYTIVSGSPLAAGESAHRAVWSGTRWTSFWKNGRLVVTWLRNGHTCVLSSVSAPLQTMVRLGAWEGDPEY